MPRSPLAYLADIIEACDAIESALREVDVARYENDRLIRSAVEREAAIKDATVWAIACHDVPVLRRECEVLMEAVGEAD